MESIQVGLRIIWKKFGGRGFRVAGKRLVSNWEWVAVLVGEETAGGEMISGFGPWTDYL